MHHCLLDVSLNFCRRLLLFAPIFILSSCCANPYLLKLLSASTMLFASFVLGALVGVAAAHGSHESSRDPASSWAEYHMAEEHHVSNFDPPSFFTLHDFNSDGVWTPEEVRRFYGLDDESLKDTPADVKDKGKSEEKAFERFR
jgi:hypothetical protein